jgi:hypothetical protein
METGQCALEPLQVSIFNPVEDVDVLGEFGRALEGCSDTTDDDELDLLLAEDE